MKAKSFIGKYLTNLFLAVDLFANALLFGDPEETISSRLGKHQDAGHDCKLCDWICWVLDKIDPRHCDKSRNALQGRGSDDDDELWK